MGETSDDTIKLPGSTKPQVCTAEGEPGLPGSEPASPVRMLNTTRAPS